MNQLLQNSPCVPRETEAMKYRGNYLARTKFFLVSNDEETNVKQRKEKKTVTKKQEEMIKGLIEHSNVVINGHGNPPNFLRRYRYPGWQWESMLFYRTFDYVPIVKQIADTCTQYLKFCIKEKDETGEELVEEKENKSQLKPVIVNHVIGTKYLDGEDYIGFHSDKMHDITPGSLILLLSMGEIRELHLRKIGTEIAENFVVMEPGSLFILGPLTNKIMEHSIVKLKDEKIVKRKITKLKPRLSLVLRDIKTIISLEDILKEVIKSKKSKENAKKKKEERKRKQEPTDKESEEEDKGFEKKKENPNKKRKVN